MEGPEAVQSVQKPDLGGGDCQSDVSGCPEAAGFHRHPARVLDRAPGGGAVLVLPVADSGSSSLDRAGHPRCHGACQLPVPGQQSSQTSGDVPSVITGRPSVCL